jgi:predicted TIM-barrel fold metal-dependent hydrolase
MKPFVFSCDAHILEPLDLFTSRMPDHLKPWAPNAVVDDKGMRLNRLGETLLFKMPANFHEHKVGDANDLDIRRKGKFDLKLRFADMHRDGVDAEVVFPSLGLLAPRITDREAARVAAEIYNDWAWEYLDGVRHTLIPAAIMPLVNFDDGLAELRRVIAKGYRTIMMPVSLFDTCPQYNDPKWDEFFKVCADNEIPLSFHTGVGNVPLRAMRGPGGAVFNYTRQMNDAVDVIAALVGSGVLDRNPNAHILFAECGATWLLGLAERLDEVYFGHAPMVSPKLSRKPSDIVRAQVHCAFQNDPGFLLTLPQMPPEAFLFATDYPHSEGTFPRSMELVNKVMQAPGPSEAQKLAIVGGNAARLYHTSPEIVARETAQKLAA